MRACAPHLIIGAEHHLGETGDHMKADIDKLTASVKLLRNEVSELEAEFAKWDAESTAGGKRLRSIARRITLGSQRLELFVKENTYSPS